MLIKLFDIQNGVLVPSEHCYTIKVLKDIMQEFPEDYLKIYTYVFYMTCPSPELNPFFYTPEEDKEYLILKELDADFSTEEDLIIEAIKLCKKLYETPTARAYNGIAKMLDRLADYMSSTEITHGRDGNITALINAAAKYEQIRQAYKGAFRDLQEEQQTHVRGGAGLAYDQTS